METFNEVTTLLILYILMLFSDYIGDPVTRSLVGLAYMGIIVGFALVHLGPLIVDSLKKIHQSCKKFFVKRQIANRKGRMIKDKVMEQA